MSSVRPDQPPRPPGSDLPDPRTLLRQLEARAPDWAKTVRFRLTVAYSSLLFLLAALVVGAIYLGVAARVRSQPVAETFGAFKGITTPSGRFLPLEQIQVADVRAIEAAANARTLETLRDYSFLTLAGLFLASLAIGWWLSGRALRPVARITRTAQEITASDLSRRIRLAGPQDELRGLADTLDGMLDRLDAAFAAQRQLVDDASHELRNPLAVIRANVEAVLARDDASPEDRARAVDVVERATARMTRLVDDLLATSRRAGPEFREADVDLAAVAAEAAEEAALVAAGRRVSVRPVLASGVVVNGDRDALRRAIGNLLDNAVRHSPDGDEVLLAAGRLGDWAWVAVRDTGPGIAVTDQRRVFDRFYRVGRRGGHDGHAGLGLAIVRQIAESHGGAVVVHSTLGAGATFVLWVPVTGAPGGTGGEVSGTGGFAAPVDTDPLRVPARP